MAQWFTRSPSNTVRIPLPAFASRGLAQSLTPLKAVMLVLYWSSCNLSWNPTEVYIFYREKLLVKNENKQKEARNGTFKKFDILNSQLITFKATHHNLQLAKTIFIKSYKKCFLSFCQRKISPQTSSLNPGLNLQFLSGLNLNSQATVRGMDSETMVPTSFLA